MKTRTTLAITLLSAASLSLLTACSDEGGTNPQQLTPRGIVVLDGFIQPGLTLLPDSGSSTQRIALGAPNEFDAGSFSLRNDTVLAASSRGAGDLLYIVPLQTGTVRRIQMPARSNPARARLLEGTGGNTLIGVPLRDNGALALVTIAPSGSFTTAIIGDLGACPSDVFQYGGDLWVVDANATCSTTYRPSGAMRLIRLRSGGTRDIIPLGALRGSDASVIVQGNNAYISAGGDADFSSFPYRVVVGGAIASVDLVTGNVLGARTMPAGTYGASTKLGLDGKLHVSLYEDLENYRTRTISYSIPTLVPTGTRVQGRDWLALRNAAGEQVSCGASMADGLGRLHCIENRTGSATFLMVFAPDGSLVREVPAGQGGVDLRFR